MKDNNDDDFKKQIEHKVGWINKYPEAKDNLFNKEEELFYRMTNYRG